MSASRRIGARASASVFSVMLCAVLCASVVVACASSQREGLERAKLAYQEGEYGTAISAARGVTEGVSGGARSETLDSARYIEGMANLKLGRLVQAIELLTSASHSTVPSIATDACIALGSAEIRREHYAAAEEAYRRAAARLNGEERARALAIADRAHARSQAAAAATSAPSTAVSTPSLTMSAPVKTTNAANAANATPTASAQTAREAPPPRVTPAAVAVAKNYAIQAGAFSEKTRALAASAQLREKARASTLGEPRVVEKTVDGGRTMYVVQIGAFANRSLAGAAMKPFAKLACTVEPYAE